MRRGKPLPMVYILMFLTRRMVLALTFVYLSHSYALQVFIWLLLSLGTIFIILKIKPFGDVVMNWVQLINELFIFVSGIILLPLTNILTNLNSRDELGIVMAIVLIVCIAFNIIVLLLRSCYLGYHLMCKVPIPEKEPPIDVKEDDSVASSNSTKKDKPMRKVDFTRK